MQATARAHPNIALVKYWGKRDVPLNLPAVPSLSLTLDTFQTVTTVAFDGPHRSDDVHAYDRVEVNDEVLRGRGAARVSEFLDLVWSGRPAARVRSHNNFPTAAGLASSSSAFSALALAGSAAAGMSRSKTELSVLARRGSGSACRSLWGGWVTWGTGIRPDGTDSHGEPLAPADHWDVRLVVAVVASGPKTVGSTAGMITTQQTCPLYPGWVSSAEADLVAARDAVLRRDLSGLGEVMEHSTLKMHATMMATRPPIRYWKAATVAALDVVEDLRRQGVGAWATMDAGPNVKVLCEAADAQTVAAALREVVPEVSVLGVGGDAEVVPTPDSSP